MALLDQQSALASGQGLLSADRLFRACASRPHYSERVFTTDIGDTRGLFPAPWTALSIVFCCKYFLCNDRNLLALNDHLPPGACIRIPHRLAERDKYCRLLPLAHCRKLHRSNLKREPCHGHVTRESSQRQRPPVCRQ